MPRGQSRGAYVCPCGKPFTRTRKAGRKPPRYCSRACASKALAAGRNRVFGSIVGDVR